MPHTSISTTPKTHPLAAECDARNRESEYENKNRKKEFVSDNIKLLAPRTLNRRSLNRKLIEREMMRGKHRKIAGGGNEFSSTMKAKVLQ